MTAVAATEPLLASNKRPAAPDDQDLLEAGSTRTFPVTFFEDFEAKTKREESLSLDVLADRVRMTTAATKEALPWLKFARFGVIPNPKTSSGSLRWNGNVLRISGAIGEHDGGEMTPKEAAERLDKAGLDAIVYTSPRHTDAVPRWRVGCPFSAELPPDRHHQMVARLNGLLGGILSPESFTLSQAYFFGSVNGNPAHRAIVVEGTATLDRADELDEIAIGKPNGGNGQVKAWGSPEAEIRDIIGALDAIPNPIPSWDLKNGTWIQWNNIGMAIWRSSAGSAEGFAAFDKWSAKWSAKYDSEEAEFRWNHYFKSPPNNIGFGTLVYLARQAQPGWVPPSRGIAHLPEIRLHPGRRERVVDALEDALLAADCGLYCHGNRLVEIGWQEIAVADGGKDRSLQLVPITELGLVERLSRAAVFKKYSKTDEKWITCDAPKDVAQTYLERSKKRMPVLFGVVTAPTLRYDGSILQEPGYDERGRIFFEPNGVPFPTILDKPTRAQALAALEQLKALIRGYRFDAAGRSVTLSCTITGVVRSALPAAPGHGFDAPVPGSGKTKLFDIASVLATGHRAAAIAASAGRNATDELYKQLAASVLAGDQMILLDNLEIVLDLPLLCQILTEEKVTIRQFGRLKNVVAACVALVGATGNNLAIAGDNMRRFVVARILIDVERPELREFGFDPVEEARNHRPDLVAAALTVVRAYLVSGGRQKLPPLGSFERWSRWVREALVWLGEADPVDTMERIRTVDTAMIRRRQLMKAWPFATETSVATVIARAQERVQKTEVDPTTGQRRASLAWYPATGTIHWNT
jgi:hypothetical protein